uniref:(northern house mosquito) hypothetical protein n=1 Tax=Culex pipiens TaxID=7175 RepID=A0A8D8IFM5_CULPI
MSPGFAGLTSGSSRPSCLATFPSVSGLTSGFLSGVLLFFSSLSMEALLSRNAVSSCWIRFRCSSFFTISAARSASRRLKSLSRSFSALVASFSRSSSSIFI